MKKVQTNVSSPKSQQEVYEYLADFANQSEWRFDVLESTLVSGEPGQVGARYRQRVKQGRRETETNVEVTQADAPGIVGFRTLDDAPVTASGTWNISESGGRTQVAADIALETHGFVKLFEPLMGPTMRKTAARYQEALSERLA